jgi:hypothetical protein
VIVAHHETWRAEAWAKAVFVAGVADGLALLDDRGLRGWIVHDNGRCVASEAAHRQVLQ